MVKVLHVMNTLLPSGAETMLKTAAPYWKKNLEMHILATQKELGSYSSELMSAGYQIHHIYDPSFIRQLKRVSDFIKSEKFDIVHIHRESKSLEYEFIAYKAGVKNIVRTVHNVFLFDGLLRIRRRITRWLGYKLEVEYVAISESVLQNEKMRYGIDCCLINNWYDENRFYFVSPEMKRRAREIIGVESKQFCIVSVGNCSRVKNHMEILKALTSKMLKENNILYFHVGKGDCENDEKLFVSKNNLNSMVRFVGFQDPLLYLQASDLFLMPSIYEGVGISALEAIATGMHCLLTDVYGLKDFKKQEFEFVYYCNTDAESIAESIKKLITYDNGNSMTQSEKVRKHYCSTPCSMP